MGQLSHWVLKDQTFLILILLFLFTVAMHFFGWAIRRLLLDDVLAPNIIPAKTLFGYSLFLYIPTAFLAFLCKEKCIIFIDLLLYVWLVFLLIVLVMIAMKLNKVYTSIFDCYSYYMPISNLKSMLLNLLMISNFVFAGIYSGKSFVGKHSIFSSIFIYFLAVIFVGLVYQYLFIRSFGEVRLKLKNNTYEVGYLINENKYGFKIKSCCGALLFIPREEVTRIQINQSKNRLY